MRIWFLASEYPPDFGGGIGTYTRNAALAMAEAGHEVLVVTLGQDENCWKLEKEGRNWWVCRMKKIAGEKEDPIKYWQDLSREFAETVRELLELGAAAEPDLIEIQDYNAIGYDLLKERLEGKAEKLKQALIGIYLHAPNFELAVANQANMAASFNQLIMKREKACLMMVDGLMAPSLFLKKLIETRMMEKRKVSLMPCPYYPEKKERREILAVEEKRKNYLCIGRLEYLKGTLQLVQAMKKRWESGSKETLTLIGEDTFFEPSGMTVRTMIEEVGQKWIKKGQLVIKDKMPAEKLAAERARADAVIVPSLYDNFPYTVTEAMAIGRAVLVNRSGGGAAEMVGEQGEGGWLFDWSIEGSFDLCLDNFEELKVKEIEKRVRAGQRRIRKMTNPKVFAAEKVKFGEKLRKERMEKEGEGVGVGAAGAKEDMETGVKTKMKMGAEAIQLKRTVQTINAFEQGLKIRRGLKKIWNGVRKWRVRRRGGSFEVRS